MKVQLITNNYLHIPKFISKENALDLAKQFKDHADKFNLLGDSQVPISRGMHNFIPFVRLLVEKIPHVSELIDEPVLPTYSYARIYERNAVLERHRDRAACEISITLNLNKDHEWPIYFQKPDKSEIGIDLEPGDAILYLGCQADHWRLRFNGTEYAQVFLHYVRSYGSRAWAVFDINKQQMPTQPINEIPTTTL